MSMKLKSPNRLDKGQEEVIVCRNHARQLIESFGYYVVNLSPEECQFCLKNHVIVDDEED